MGAELAYASIVLAPTEFAGRCEIMPRGRNGTHGLSCPVSPMAGASLLGASPGAFAAALRRANPDAAGDGWTRKALARADPETAADAPEDATAKQPERPAKAGIATGRKPAIAIDRRPIPGCDKKPGMWPPRSKGKRGANAFGAYITAQAVDGGRRLTPVSLPIGAGDSPAGFALKTVKGCDKMDAGVGRFPMDREFFAVSALDAMDKAGRKCLVPRRNAHNAAGPGKFGGGVREAVSECTPESDKSSVKCPMVTVKGKSGGKPGPDAKPRERLVGFAMNSNETDIVAYKSGRGAETGCRVTEDARLRTRGANPAAGHPCFAASIALYNQWAVLNAPEGFHPEDGWTGTAFTILRPKTATMAQTGIKPEPPPTAVG